MSRPLLFLILLLSATALPAQGCSCEAALTDLAKRLQKTPSYKAQVRSPEQKAAFRDHIGRVRDQMTAAERPGFDCGYLLGLATTFLTDNHLRVLPPSDTFPADIPHYPGGTDALAALPARADDSAAGLYYRGEKPVAYLTDDGDGVYSAYLLQAGGGRAAGSLTARFHPAPAGGAYYTQYVRPEGRTQFIYERGLAEAIGRFKMTRTPGEAEPWRATGTEAVAEHRSLADNAYYLYLPSFRSLGSNNPVAQLNALYAGILPDLPRNGHLIIDLRGNGGGGTRAYRELLAGLAERDDVRLHLITNRNTASAAELFVTEMKARGARHYGEPTNGTYHYGYGNRAQSVTPLCNGAVPYLTTRSELGKRDQRLATERSGIPADVPLTSADWIGEVVKQLR